MTTGWGTADRGGNWTIPSGASRYSVGSGVGRVNLTAGAGTTATLPGVSATDTETKVSVSMDKASTGGGQYVSVIGRSVSGVGDYRAKVRVLSTGAVSLSLVKMIGTTETALTTTTVPGLTYTAGDTLNIRLQVVGTSPTNLKAKVWKSTAAEPGSWTLDRQRHDQRAASRGRGRSVQLLVRLSDQCARRDVLTTISGQAFRSNRADIGEVASVVNSLSHWSRQMLTPFDMR